MNIALKYLGSQRSSKPERIEVKLYNVSIIYSINLSAIQQQPMPLNLARSLFEKENAFYERGENNIVQMQ